MPFIRISTFFYYSPDEVERAEVSRRFLRSRFCAQSGEHRTARGASGHYPRIPFAMVSRCMLLVPS